MRGKEEEMQKHEYMARITPAYAGKSLPTPCSKTSFRDHPRLCGEKPRSPAAKGTSRGSPPPMRGKVNPTHVKLIDGGITPAYAGKSKHRYFPSLETIGSPPPMRGKAHKASMTLHRSGITPAYAGKSGIQGLKRVLKKDHPRLCGEKG